MKLKRYRRSKGISSKTFAETLGINLSTLWRYEAGERFPPRSMLLKILDVTKGAVGPGDFLEGPTKCT